MDGELVLKRSVLPNRILSIFTIHRGDDIWIVHQVNAGTAAFLTGCPELEYPVDSICFGKQYYIGIKVSDLVLPVNELPTIDYLLALFQHYTLFTITRGNYQPLTFNPNRKYI